MQDVLILGAGKIGATIATLLACSGDYHVFLADKQHRALPLKESDTLEKIILDIEKTKDLKTFLKKHTISGIISCLPYFYSTTIANLAKEYGMHYFDLTEDVDTADAITKLASKQKQAFIPQCGLAPGFINIMANDLIQQFTDVDLVKLRCGALPVDTSNALQYALLWSIDGLINECGNPCQAIEDKQLVSLPPLENLEDLQLDGLNYEAFNTSGGLGSLATTYAGKINTLNYKTIRYPGHCEKMRFLMSDLKLNQDRDTLKKILLNALPSTNQDVVIIYVSVHGKQNQKFLKKSYTKKFYPCEIDGIHYSAIQLTTACGACAVIDIVLSHPETYHGRILQEQFSLNDIESNRFWILRKENNSHEST